MILSLINRPCMLHRSVTSETETDAMGDPLVEEVDDPTVCEIQQQQRFEQRDGQQVLVSVWQVFLLPSEDVDGWDSITVAPPEVDEDAWDGVTGDRYSLEGEPWPVRHPRKGVVHHIEATARKVS